MNFNISPFGVLDGTKVWLFTFVTEHGMEFSITNYGLTITNIERYQYENSESLIYGYSNFKAYRENAFQPGGLRGFFATIDDAQGFSDDGNANRLNHNSLDFWVEPIDLGFERKLWNLLSFEHADGVATLQFFLRTNVIYRGVSHNLEVWANYQIADDNQIGLTCMAKSDCRAFVDIFNRSYFNLGDYKIDIPKLQLHINADSYIPDNQCNINSDEFLRVQKTPFDFRKLSVIEKRLQLPINEDFNCFYRVKQSGLEKPVAVLRNQSNGCELAIYSNYPCLQLHLASTIPSDFPFNLPSHQPWAICLDSRAYPNLANADSSTGLAQSRSKFGNTVVYTFSFYD